MHWGQKSNLSIEKADQFGADLRNQLFAALPISSSSMAKRSRPETDKHGTG
jgi:hypothetical protein